MRMSKRILAMLLTVLMVVSVAPMAVVQAAAENITEAVSDLGDALAVNSEEPAAEAPAADKEEASPADDPAAEPEQAEDEAPASEPEQGETEADVSETEADVSETEAAASETEAAASETEADTSAAAADEATTEAITKAARRAPLIAGPEVSLGLEGYNSGKTRFEFNENGLFKILQLSDIQTDEGFYRQNNDSSPSGGVIRNGISRFTINAIQGAIRAYQPDLVVLTGDQINAESNHTKMTEANLRTTIQHYKDIITAEDANIKVAVLFGNHDSLLVITDNNGNVTYAAGPASTQRQYNLYKEIFGNNFVDYEALSGTSGFSGTGNGKIDIYSSSSIAAQVYLFDTQETCIGDSSGETASSANKEIVDWYAQNATVPNLVFQHIVPNEIALYGEDGSYITAGQNNNLIRGVSNHTFSGPIQNKAQTANLTADVELVTDNADVQNTLREYPGPYGTSIDRLATKQQFIAMADHRCMGVFFGHDHTNSYQGTCTVYNKNVNFYACPGMTSEEYYAPRKIYTEDGLNYEEETPVPAVRVIGLNYNPQDNNHGTDHVWVDSAVYDMEQIELLAATQSVAGDKTRVQQDNVVGVLNGGVPAMETIAVPQVLYRGSNDNNTDPINNQGLGTVLQQYVYNYEEVHLYATNTAARFVLPTSASGVSVSVYKSTATGNTVSLTGSPTSVTPSVTAVESGGKLYTAQLPSGFDLGGVYYVVFKVTYTVNGTTKTMYGTSCVEDINIPAGYAVSVAAYQDSGTTATSRFNSMLQQKYLFTISGKGVYGRNNNNASKTIIDDDSRKMVLGYTNGWQKVFSKKDVGLNGTRVSGTSNANSTQWQDVWSTYQPIALGTATDNNKYALSYHGYNLETDDYYTYLRFNLYQKAMYTINMGDGEGYPPTAEIYIDTSTTTTTASNGKTDYGARITFSSSHATDTCTYEQQGNWARNIRDYPTYVTGIGFQTLPSGENYYDYRSVIGNCANDGIWRATTDPGDAANFINGAGAALEEDVHSGNGQFYSVFAPNQYLSNVTTTHTNGTGADNEIQNNAIRSYAITSTGTGNSDYPGEARLSMLVGTRNIRPWRYKNGTGGYISGNEYNVLYVLQPVNLEFHTYDKGSLRTLVQSEMSVHRDASDSSIDKFNTWRQKLLNAQAVLANNKVTASQISTALSELTTAKSALGTAPDPNVQYITAFNVPSILYAKKASGSTNSTTAATLICYGDNDGLDATADANNYNTTISITAASTDIASTMTLYTGNGTDAAMTQLTLTGTGATRTANLDIPAAKKSITLDSTHHDSVWYYRLEFEAKDSKGNPKVYTMYAASYVRERPLTVGRWYWDAYNSVNTDKASDISTGFVFTHTFDVSETLKQSGASAIVSAWQGDTTSALTEEQFGNSSMGYGTTALSNEWSKDAYTHYELYTDEDDTYGRADFSYRAIEYNRWSGTADLKDITTINGATIKQSGTSGGGGVLTMTNATLYFAKAAGDRENHQDSYGLFGPDQGQWDGSWDEYQVNQNPTEGGFKPKDYLCINYYYDDNFSNYNGLKGKETFQTYSGSHHFSYANSGNISSGTFADMYWFWTEGNDTAPDTKINQPYYNWMYRYRATSLDGARHSSDSDKRSTIPNATAFPHRSYTASLSNGSAITESSKSAENSKMTWTTPTGTLKPNEASTAQTGNFYASGLWADKTYQSFLFHKGAQPTDNYKYKDGSNDKEEGKPHKCVGYGVIFSYIRVDRGNWHSQVQNSLQYSLHKEDYDSTWWNDYRSQVFKAYKNAGNIFYEPSGETNASAGVTIPKMSDRDSHTLCDYGPLYKAINDVCASAENGSGVGLKAGHDGLGSNGWDTSVFYATSATMDPAYAGLKYHENQYKGVSTSGSETGIYKLVKQIKERTTLYTGTRSETDQSTWTHKPYSAQDQKAIDDYAAKIYEYAAQIELLPADYSGLDEVSNLVIAGEHLSEGAADLMSVDAGCYVVFKSNRQFGKAAIYDTLDLANVSDSTGTVAGTTRRDAMLTKAADRTISDTVNGVTYKLLSVNYLDKITVNAYLTHATYGDDVAGGQIPDDLKAPSMYAEVGSYKRMYNTNSIDTINWDTPNGADTNDSTATYVQTARKYYELLRFRVAEELYSSCGQTPDDTHTYGIVYMKLDENLDYTPSPVSQYVKGQDGGSRGAIVYTKENGAFGTRYDSDDAVYWPKAPAGEDHTTDGTYDTNILGLIWGEFALVLTGSDANAVWHGNTVYGGSRDWTNPTRTVLNKNGTTTTIAVYTDGSNASTNSWSTYHNSLTGSSGTVGTNLLKYARVSRGLLTTMEANMTGKSGENYIQGYAYRIKKFLEDEVTGKAVITHSTGLNTFVAATANTDTANTVVGTLKFADANKTAYLNPQINTRATYEYAGSGSTEYGTFWNSHTYSDYSGIKVARAEDGTALSTGGAAWYTAATWDPYSTARTAAEACTSKKAYDQADVNAAAQALDTAYGNLVTTKLSDYRAASGGVKLNDVDSDKWGAYSDIITNAPGVNTSFTSQVSYKTVSVGDDDQMNLGTAYYDKYADRATWDAAYTGTGKFKATYIDSNHASADLATYVKDFTDQLTALNSALRTQTAANRSEMLKVLNDNNCRPLYDYDGRNYRGALSLGSVSYTPTTNVTGVGAKTYGKTWYKDDATNDPGWTAYENARKALLAYVDGAPTTYTYGTAYTINNSSSVSQSTIDSLLTTVRSKHNDLELKTLDSFVETDATKALTYGDEQTGLSDAQIKNAASLMNDHINGATVPVTTVSIGNDGKATVTANARSVYTNANKDGWNKTTAPKGVYTLYLEAYGGTGSDDNNTANMILADNITAYRAAVTAMREFNPGNTGQTADYSELLKMFASNTRAPLDIGYGNTTNAHYTNAMKTATGFADATDQYTAALPSGFNTCGKTWYATDEWNAYSQARNTAAALLGGYDTTNNKFNYSTTYTAGSATAVSKQADINTALSNLAAAYNALLDAPRMLADYGQVNTVSTFGQTSFSGIYTEAGTRNTEMNTSNIPVVYYKQSTSDIDTKYVTKYTSASITAWNNPYDTTTTGNKNLAHYNTNKDTLTLAESFTAYREVLDDLDYAYTHRVETPADYSGLTGYIAMVPTYDIGGTLYRNLTLSSAPLTPKKNGVTYGATWYVGSPASGGNAATGWYAYEDARDAAVVILTANNATPETVFDIDNVSDYASATPGGSVAANQAAINAAATALANAYKALTPKKLNEYDGTWQGETGYSAINTKASALNTEIQNEKVNVTTVTDNPSTTTGTVQSYYYSATFRDDMQTAYNNLNTYCTTTTNNGTSNLADAYDTYLSRLSTIATHYNNRSSNKAAPNYTYLAKLLGQNWIPTYAKKGAQGIALFGNNSTFDGDDWYSNWSTYTTAADYAITHYTRTEDTAYSSVTAYGNNYGTAKTSLTTDDQAAINDAVDDLRDAYFALTLKTLSDYTYAGTYAINGTNAATSNYSGILDLIDSRFLDYTETVRVRNGFTSEDNSTANTDDFEDYNVYKQDNNATLAAEKNAIHGTVSPGFSSTDTLVTNYTDFTNAIETFASHLTTNMTGSNVNPAKYDYLIEQMTTWADYDGYTAGSSGDWGTTYGGASYQAAVASAKTQTPQLDSIIASHGDTWYSSGTWTPYATARSNGAKFLKNNSSNYSYTTDYTTGNTTYTAKQSVTFNNTTAIAQNHINDLAYEIYAKRALLAVAATLANYGESWSAWDADGNDETLTGWSDIINFVGNDNNFSWVYATVDVYTIDSNNALDKTTVKGNVYTNAAISAIETARENVRIYGQGDTVGFSSGDSLSRAGAFSAALNALKAAYTANHNVNGSLAGVYTDGWDGIFEHLTDNAAGTSFDGTGSNQSVTSSSLTTYLSYLYGGTTKVNPATVYASGGMSINNIISAESGNNTSSKKAQSNQATFNDYVEKLYNELNAIVVDSSVKMDNAANTATTEGNTRQAVYDPLNHISDDWAYQYTSTSRGNLATFISTTRGTADDASAWYATPANFGWHESGHEFNGVYANKIRLAAGLTSDDNSVSQSNLLVLNDLFTEALTDAINYAKGELYETGTTTVKTFPVLTSLTLNNGTVTKGYTNVTKFTTESITRLTAAITAAENKKTAAEDPTSQLVTGLTKANWMEAQQAIDQLIKDLVDKTDIANTINIVGVNPTTSANDYLYGNLTSVGDDNGLKYVKADYDFVNTQKTTPMYKDDLDSTIKNKIWSTNTNTPIKSGDNYVAENYYTDTTWDAYIGAYDAAVIPAENSKLPATQQSTVDALAEAIFTARNALEYKKLGTATAVCNNANDAMVNATSAMNTKFYLEKYVNDYDLFASRWVVEDGELTKTYVTGEENDGTLDEMADRHMSIYSTEAQNAITAQIAVVAGFYDNRNTTKTMADEQDLIDATNALNAMFVVNGSNWVRPLALNATVTDPQDPNYGKKVFGAGFDDLLEGFISGTYDGTTFTSDKLPQDISLLIAPYLSNIYSLLNGSVPINSSVTVTVNNEAQPMTAYQALNFYTNELYEFCTTTRAVGATFATDLKNTLYAYYDKTITVDAGSLLSGCTLLGGNPANIYLFNQTQVATKKSAIDGFFAVDDNWPLIFQLNGLQYYKYGENGTQGSPSYTNEKCVEYYITGNSTSYYIDYDRYDEIDDYIYDNDLDAIDPEDDAVNKIIGFLDLVGTKSASYRVSTNEYGASDLYKWLMNCVENRSVSGYTYLLGSTTTATLPSVGGASIAYGPGWYYTDCGEHNLTNSNLTATEKDEYYYYQLSSTAKAVYGSSYGSWFSDATYQAYQTKRAAMEAITTTNKLAEVSGGRYVSRNIADPNTASNAYKTAIQTNGWTSAAQSQFFNSVASEHSLLCRTMKEYYEAILGLQKLTAYEAYEKAYNLIAMANNKVVEYHPASDASGYTAVTGVNSKLNLYVLDHGVLADKACSNIGGYLPADVGDAIGGRAYARAKNTLDHQANMMVYVSDSTSMYNGCYFSTWLPQYYTDGEIAEAETIFTSATALDSSLRTVDRSNEIFSLEPASTYASPIGTLALSIKAKLDDIYLKGADTKSLTKLILMFMCNSIEYGLPTSYEYSAADGGDKIGLGALDYIMANADYTSGLWDSGLYNATDGYRDIIFNQQTGLGKSGAAAQYINNPLMQTVAEGGCMSHTNALASEKGLSTTGGTITVRVKQGNKWVNKNEPVTGLSTTMGFYFYDNYDPATLVSIIQYMKDKELIRPGSVQNAAAFQYNWTASKLTEGSGDDQRATFFLSTGFFEQEKVTAMCQNLIRLYNGENITETDPDSGITTTYYGLRLKKSQNHDALVTKLAARRAIANKIYKDWSTYNLASADWSKFTTLRNETEAMFNFKLGNESLLNFMLESNGRTGLTDEHKGITELIGGTTPYGGFGKVLVEDYEDTDVAEGVVNSADNSFDAPGATAPNNSQKWNQSLLYRLLHADADSTDSSGARIHYRDESAPTGKVVVDTASARSFAESAANAKYFPELRTLNERRSITSGTFVQPNASGYTMYIYTNQLNPYFVIKLQEQLNNVRGADGESITVDGEGLIDPAAAQAAAAAKGTTVAQYNCSKPEKMTIQARAAGTASASATAWDPDSKTMQTVNLAVANSLQTMYTETEPLEDGTYAMDSSAIVVLKPHFDSTATGAQYVAYSIVANDNAVESKTNPNSDNVSNGTNVEYSSDYKMDTSTTTSKITIMVYYQNSELHASNGTTLDEGFITARNDSTNATGWTEKIPVINATDSSKVDYYQYFASSVRNYREQNGISASRWISGERLQRYFYNSNMRQWEYVSSTQYEAQLPNPTNLPIASDPDFGLADLGSFIYAIDLNKVSNQNENSLEYLNYQVVSEYYETLDGDMDYSDEAASDAKDKMVDLLKNNATYQTLVRNAILDSSNDDVVDYGSTANWSHPISSHYPNGTLIFVHVLDRWGNRVNRMFVIDKVDSTAPTVEATGIGEVTVTEENGSGLSTIDAFNYAGTTGASLYADYHHTNYLFQNISDTVCYEGDSFTVGGFVPNRLYTIGAKNTAGIVGSANVQADADGNITIKVETGEYSPEIYNVAGAPVTLENCSDGEDVGVIDFIFNSTDTVILNYALLTSIVSAGPEGSVIANKANTPLNVTTQDNVNEVKLVEQDGATEIWTPETTGVTVTDNENGTKTWTKKYTFSAGKHYYTAYAKTADEYEIGGVDFTVNATTATVTLKFQTTGMGKFMVYYNGGMKKTCSTRTDISVAVGDIITLVAEPKTVNGYTYDFLFWNNKNTERMISTDSTYKFEAVSNMSLMGQFSPNSLSEDDGNKVVIYVNQAGNILKNYEIPTGGSYTVPAGPILQDHVFKGWSMTQEEVLASEKRTVIVTPVYSIGETYTVTIQNGDYAATGAGIYTCENDERALVNISTSAKNGAGQIFQYWLDCDTNDIVSYSRGYAFYAIKDTTLRPVYGDTAVTAQPVIRIAAVKYNSSAKKVNFYAERSVPGAYEVIQTGVVVTKTESVGTNSDAFVIGASGTAKGTSINTASAGFYTGVVSLNAGDTVWARGYLIYRDSAGDIHTIYSSIASYTR